MNTFIRIIVALCGIALLLPGLCTVLFGGYFALSGFSGQQMYGLGGLSIPWLIVGGLLVWGGWLVIAAALKRPSTPNPRGDKTDQGPN